MPYTFNYWSTTNYGRYWLYMERKSKIVLLTLCICIFFSTFGMLLFFQNAQREVCYQKYTLDQPKSRNMAIVNNYPVGDSHPFLESLGLANLDTRVDPIVAVEQVIITAASRNHFSESNTLLDHLKNDVQPKLQVVVYDIGLSENQLKYLKARRDCNVRKFPFEKFPEFVKNLKNFAWKPLLVQLALEEFRFVIMMDSTIYLPNGTLNDVINTAKQYNISVAHRHMSFRNYITAYVTNRRTFEFFGENPCAFKNTYLFPAGFFAIRRTNEMLRYIMRPWVSCALTKSCQTVAEESLTSICDMSQTYDNCHKYDTSVFSIILNRLYRYDDIERIDFSHKVDFKKCNHRENVMIIGDSLFYTHNQHSKNCPEVKWLKIE